MLLPRRSRSSTAPTVSGRHIRVSTASPPHVLPGHPFPLGAHSEAGGVRFAVSSSAAEAVELCLIGEGGSGRRGGAGRRPTPPPARPGPPGAPGGGHGPPGGRPRPARPAIPGAPPHI